MKFNIRYPLFAPANDYGQGGEAPQAEEVVIDEVEVDDYDPSIHDDPDSPDYRGPDWDPDAVADPVEPKVNLRGIAPAVGFDPDALGDAFARGLAKVGVVPPTKQPKVTEEDFRKTAGWKSATPEEVTELFNPDTTPERKLKLLNDMLTGAQTYATNVARGLHHDVSSRFDTYAQQQQEVARQGAVQVEVGNAVTRYPALKAYQKHLPQIFESLRATGYRPKTADEGQRMFASYAMKTIRQFVPNFSLQSQKAASSRPMAKSINNGGTPGVSKQGKKPAWRGIWD